MCVLKFKSDHISDFSLRVRARKSIAAPLRMKKNWANFKFITFFQTNRQQSWLKNEGETVPAGTEKTATCSLGVDCNWTSRGSILVDLLINWWKMMWLTEGTAGKPLGRPPTFHKIFLHQPLTRHSVRKCPEQCPLWCTAMHCDAMWCVPRAWGSSSAWWPDEMPCLTIFPCLHVEDKLSSVQNRQWLLLAWKPTAGSEPTTGKQVGFHAEPTTTWLRGKEYTALGLRPKTQAKSEQGSHPNTPPGQHIPRIATADTSGRQEKLTQKEILTKAQWHLKFWMDQTLSW